MDTIDSNPLVSIITPFFNTEKFLQECIESVISQTYSNWELILVNDGSIDGSIAIAKRYTDEFPDKIVCLSHPNLENEGASASRNLGFRHSKGKFIAFLDSDDVYLPLKLEKQVPILLANPKAGMLYSETEYWYSWTGSFEDKDKDWVWNYFGMKPNTLVYPPDLLAIYLKDGDTVPCMGSTLVRRETILSIGGWEDNFKFINTDQVFHAKICLKWPVFVSSGCYDRYRQHQDSSTHKVERERKGFAARYKYLSWLEKYLIKQKANKNQELWNSFKLAKSPFKHYHKMVLSNHIKRIFKKMLNCLQLIFNNRDQKI